jgi:predicted Zn-dependent peptidase
VRDRDFQQTQLAIAFPAYSHRDPRRFALHLLHVILGANASSRLFQEMREKRGLCYSVSSHWTSLDDGGALEIFAGLDRKNLERALGLILSQCEALAATPPGAAELRRAKDYSIGASRMSMERPSNQSQRLGNSLFARHELVDPEEVNTAIRSVTPDEIRSVARDLLRPDRLSVVVVGPKPDEKMLRRLLALP